MVEVKQKFLLSLNKGQSATELAIFGSILIFVISLIFRQGISGGNFMNAQMKAARFAMSQSLAGSTAQENSRNNASVLVIEDRLAGDFADKFGSRDRTPVIASGNASFSAQMFQPFNIDDFGNQAMLPHYNVWVNGQQFSFLTSNYKTVSIPTSQGSLALCSQPHSDDTRCWLQNCLGPNVGCVQLQKMVQNYPGSKFTNASNNFDLKFDNTNQVPVSLRDPMGTGSAMQFMWQWQPVNAVKGMSKDDAVDVDGDYYGEQILQINDDGTRVTSINVVDQQDGDIDFTVDGRRPNVRMGLLDDSQMFSFTRSGTTYKIQEGKLFNASPGGRFIRNTNRNDHIDFVQRIFQLSHNTGRFCNGGNPVAGSGVEVCGATHDDCFTNINIRKTCMDTSTLRIYIRSRILNQGGRSWFTRTESGS